nr:MAG TPA: structural protein [Caudoviricetes sp.]
MTIPQPTAPQALRRAKDAAGETNRSLAEKSGVPEHTVAKILSGATQNPTYDQVAAMAVALDLDLNTLDHVQPQPTAAAEAVTQAQLDGANQIIALYKERLAVYERGVRQRNVIICALLGLLSVFATAFVAYVIMDARNPDYGFIRPGSPAGLWLCLLCILVAIPLLGTLTAALSITIRRTRGTP